MIPWTWLTAALVWGFVFGRWFEARVWRRNADDYRNIESWGALYKVTREKP